MAAMQIDIIWELAMRAMGRSIAAAMLLIPLAGLRADEFTIEKTEQGVRIQAAGQLVAEYLTRSGNKPVLFPLLGPTGKRMTRGFPIEPQAGETHDHVHQRGLWFTHGDVNGVNFWSHDNNAGRIEHQEFSELAGGATAKVSTRNDWLAPSGEKVCSDTRTFVFSIDRGADSAAAKEASSGDKSASMIDVEINILAGERDVTFGDTKEGSFGTRVADVIRVEAKAGGQIVNSAGQLDDKAWGQPADWVDYHGTIDDQLVGIAIFNHPASFNYPTRWHVRGYGLFAANPFGLQAFDPAQAPRPYVLPAGKSLLLRYRVVLHRGDEKQARLEQRFAEYARMQFAVPLQPAILR